VKAGGSRSAHTRSMGDRGRVRRRSLPGRGTAVARDRQADAGLVGVAVAGVGAGRRCAAVGRVSVVRRAAHRRGRPRRAPVDLPRGADRRLAGVDGGRNRADRQAAGGPGEPRRSSTTAGPSTARRTRRCGTTRRRPTSWPSGSVRCRPGSTKWASPWRWRGTTRRRSPWGRGQSPPPRARPPSSETALPPARSATDQPEAGQRQMCRLGSRRVQHDHCRCRHVRVRHAKPSTTAGYVKRPGRGLEAVATRWAERVEFGLGPGHVPPR
jgi:hypothetical protein